MATAEQLKRYQTVLSENENNVFLATSNKENDIAASIITIQQDKEKPNVFYVTTDPNSKRAHDIEQHPQVGLATWYDHKNGDRLSTNNATASVETDLATMEKIAEPFPEMTKFGPLKGQCILTITFHSVLIESFTGKPEVIEF